MATATGPGPGAGAEAWRGRGVGRARHAALPRALRVPLLLAAALIGGAAAGGCAPPEGGGEGGGGAGPLELFTAGALALPLRAAADSFAAATGAARPLMEAAGSLETIRKVTELYRVPDLLAVADASLLDELVLPSWASWYVVVARDRLVLAYTPRSRGAGEVGEESWPRVVTRAGVLVGRSDPDRDPAGYRALLAMRLAERYYGSPGLGSRLLASAPAELVRPKSADLVGLLQAGELDYAWLYASTARAAGLRMVALPATVDLGDPARAADYAAESVAVAGRARGETLVVVGRPILLALTVPADAPHPEAAASFVAWLLGADGRRVLERGGLELLPRPVLAGQGAPAAIAELAGAPVGGPDDGSMIDSSGRHD